MAHQIEQKSKFQKHQRSKPRVKLSLPPRPTQRRYMAEHFPLLLSGHLDNHLVFDLNNPKPLAIDTAKQIYDRLPDDSDKPVLVKAFKRELGRWCNRNAYLKAVAAPGSVRYNLDGTVDSVIQDKHREYAASQLKQRKEDIKKSKSSYTEQVNNIRKKKGLPVKEKGKPKDGQKPYSGNKGFKGKPTGQSGNGRSGNGRSVGSNQNRPGNVRNQFGKFRHPSKKN